MSRPERCVVLVPVGGAIDPGCDDALRELEKRGYAVWRVRGYSAIDAARNPMATDAVAQGFDELVWIDSDVVVHPDDVDRLRSHRLPVVGGLDAKKSRREFAATFRPGTQNVRSGADANRQAGRLPDVGGRQAGRLSYVGSLKRAAHAAPLAGTRSEPGGRTGTGPRGTVSGSGSRASPPAGVGSAAGRRSRN